VILGVFQPNLHGANNYLVKVERGGPARTSVTGMHHRKGGLRPSGGGPRWIRSPLMPSLGLGLDIVTSAEGEERRSKERIKVGGAGLRE